MRTMRPAVPVHHLNTAVTLLLAALLILAGWTGTIAATWWRSLGLEPALWWHLIPLTLMVGPLLLKHRAPVSALGAAAPIVAVDVALGGSLGIWLCVADLIYQVGLRASLTAVRTVGVLLTLATTAATLVSAALDGGQAALSTGVSAFALLLLPLWWSAEVRRGHPFGTQDQERRDLEAERNAALVRLHERERAAAVEDERRGLARELHDTVSAQVSAVALTAGAALTGPSDSARQRAALESIRATSVEALDELRGMVTLLRGAEPVEQNGGPEAPQTAEEAVTGACEEASSSTAASASAAWAEVIRRAEAQGLAITGAGRSPDGLLDRLDDTVRTVLLRVLGEALHNARKHGDGAARVELEHRRAMLRLRATNCPASPGEDPAAAPDGGHGIQGMRERVLAVGGRMSAGPEEQPEGSTLWCVDVELPVEEQP